MSSYAQRVEEHRRLAILRMLSNMPGYRANDSILTDAVDSVGVSSSRDQVRTSIDWLAEQGLVTVEAPASLKIVTVTQRGADVAKGRARVTGVQVPGPGA